MAPAKSPLRRSPRNHPSSRAQGALQTPARVEKTSSPNSPTTQQQSPRPRIRLANPFYSGPKPSDRPRIRLANPFYSGPKPTDRPRIRLANPFYSGPKDHELVPHPDDDFETSCWKDQMRRTNKCRAWLNGLDAEQDEPEQQIKSEPDSDSESEWSCEMVTDTEGILMLEAALEMQLRSETESEVRIKSETESEVHIKSESESEMDIKLESESEMDIKLESESEMNIKLESESETEIKIEDEDD